MSIQLAPAVYFLATGKPSLSRYIIQFLSLCSFVECAFRVRVSSRVWVSVSFIFSCIILVSNVGQKSEN